MRIVFFSFYYPPDLSAGSFRASALVEALLARSGPHTMIDVVTTSPNRYAAMDVSGASDHADARLRIIRIPVPAHNSGIADQIRSFGVFARGALRATERERPDVVVATTSRLFTGALGALVARRWGAPLYLDIRDIFSETIENVFALSPVRFGMPLIRSIERWTLRRARRVNVVSPAFVDYFAPVLGEIPVSVHTNGVDEQFIDFAQANPASPTLPARPRVVTAGNIGEGQGLHHILPQLAAACPHVDFRIIGGGGRRAILESAVSAAGLANVDIIDPVARDRLTDEYAKADVLFLHLNDLAGFDRVVPSKMFEYAATGRPILAGVRGFSHQILAQVEGAECFAPCDVNAAVSGLKRLLAGPRLFDRKSFVDRYDRRQIMGAMADDILSVASLADPVTAPPADESLPHDAQVKK